VTPRPNQPTIPPSAHAPGQKHAPLFVLDVVAALCVVSRAPDRTVRSAVSSEIGDGATYWTSPDGIEWDRHDGFPMTKLPFPCHPDFPCDLEPETIEDVPFHFARPNTTAVAGRDDIVLTQVSVRYSPFKASDHSLGDLHPGLLSLAAAESTCFAELQAKETQPGQPADRQGAQLTQSGYTPEQFSATCTNGNVADSFSFDLATVLDDRQIDLVAMGSQLQLFATRADGTGQVVTNPPTHTWLQDGVGPERTSLSDVAVTNSRFWSIDNGVVVTSLDGVKWDPWPDIDLDGNTPVKVLATRGGDIAVTSAGMYHPSQPGTDPVVIVSHDDGATWGEVMPLPGGSRSRYVAAVGPAGVAVINDTDLAPGTELVFVDDQTGEALFTIEGDFSGLLADAAIGTDRVLVPTSVQRVDNVDVVIGVYDIATGLPIR